MSTATTENIIAQLGFREEILQLREILDSWIGGVHDQIKPLLEWQFITSSKYFRPLTVFSVYRATTDEPIPNRLIYSAAVVEMIHNMTLVIDDIVDESEMRRGRPTLHCQFGLLQALMAAGYIVADGFRMTAGDRIDIRLISDLIKRLGAAECLQWNLRRQPLGVEDWLMIAGEDTGSMFETCACVATRDDRLRKFGGLLGVLYHGCDDVGDVKGLESLGGGGEEDLRDGILTLPASIAIQDPNIAELFCKPTRTADELKEIAQAVKAAVPAAEERLDQIAAEAKWEAHLHCANPSILYALVDHTRELSRR
ncbi:polyprenyl synthetase family protein [Bradyrhizobium sp. IC3195]|uniref:polyprenyl synthetase family protein n=1 Tax=Bradyrhizobium sp. IC3195 TaxID=2793804 RepID=UPI001CD5B727|nr:polyprenyl synthetase family protein [Bradyrhizobium sp. IC3195]MCA1469251.1 polyprenyl synthetase family protein [Bradyrhizobium sp. IC3195]